jgi:hypothetical protein
MLNLLFTALLISTASIVFLDWLVGVASHLYYFFKPIHCDEPSPDLYK